LVRVPRVEGDDAYERLVRAAIVAVVFAYLSEVIETLELRSVAGPPAQIDNLLV
jgi:hypothetical protein